MESKSSIERSCRPQPASAVGDFGQAILMTAAVTDDPISFAELECILELSEDRLLSALTELQPLFLSPKAPAVEGEQRYQINLNTKKLVRLGYRCPQNGRFWVRVGTSFRK